MQKVDLEVIYRQNLEPSIIEYLASRNNISQRKAMDIYIIKAGFPSRYRPVSME